MALKDKLVAVKNWALAAWLRLYDNTTFYRVFWTGIAALAGYLLTFQSPNPQLMFWFTLTGTLLSSIARERIEARKVAKAAKIAAKDQNLGDDIIDVVEEAGR